MQSRTVSLVGIAWNCLKTSEGCVANPGRRLLGLSAHEAGPTGTVQGPAFHAEIIDLCVPRYLQFALASETLEELMTERKISVDQVTIWRWVQRYAPELHQRGLSELRMTSPATYSSVRQFADHTPLLLHLRVLNESFHWDRVSRA